MKVILKENIESMGYVGDVVEVSRGYARNYLFPRELAIENTRGNLKAIEHLKKKALEKRNREFVEAKELAEKLSAIHLTFKAKAGKDGKLFGSITHKDIAEFLKENHQIEIDRKKIEYHDALKKIGAYQVNVHLYKEVSATLNVSIIPEEEKKENQSEADQTSGDEEVQEKK
ncbi:MAG: 50S ribosomal protein L9 [Candidatus Atribacteria bacterium]|nr:50S ribosomal protein L9 [Candidatus Atribacteria bacterium]